LAALASFAVTAFTVQERRSWPWLCKHEY